jgi:hypothetical protein
MITRRLCTRACSRFVPDVFIRADPADRVEYCGGAGADGSPDQPPTAARQRPGTANIRHGLRGQRGQPRQLGAGQLAM